MLENECLYNSIDEGWDRFGKFAITLKSIIKNSINFDKTLFEEKFKSFNDNESRINYCINNELVVNAIKTLYEDIINTTSGDNHEKNLLKSKQLRLKGNDCFREGFYEKCLKFYSEAICLSPFPSETSSQEELIELSKSFADRSAALFRVEDYESCLLDIEEAISFGYSNDIHIKYKLLIRKALCLSSIEKYESAKEVLNDLIHSFDNNSNNSNDIKIKEEIRDILSNLENRELNDENSDEIDLNDENNDSDDNELVDKIENCNPLVPNASNCLKISYTSNKGRFMNAVNDIKFGDTLLVEYPFATYLHWDKFDTYCQHCLNSLNNRSVPCFKCNKILFCSHTCRENAWNQYHKFECNSLLKLFKEIGISYIVLRILLRVGINNAIKISKELTQQLDNENKNEVFYSGDYNSVICLLDHQNDHNLESMISYTLTAHFLLYALERNSLVKSDDQNYNYLGAIILKHTQQLSTNLISILQQDIFNDFNKFGFEGKEDIIGTAIYPTINLLNHSCDPNVLTFFRGSLLTVKASRSIKTGDEINYCYGPNFQGMSRKDRLRKLKNQYYFDCECFVCSNRRENLTRALLCPQCNGPVIHNEDFTSECLNCKSTDLDVCKAIDNVEKGLNFSLIGTDFLEKESYSEALINLHKSDELLTLNLYIQNRHLCKSKDEMCRCYALMGHFDRAVKYCLQSVKITSLIFGEQSTELLTELMKLISLKWEVVDETDDVVQKKVVANELMQIIKRADALMSKFLSTNGFESAFQAELQYLNEKKLAVLQIV